MSNIPGMSNATIQLNRTPEEKEESKESDEERTKRIEEEKSQIARFYGDDKLAAKRIFHTFIMEGDDLFNDDLIDAIDSLPTYARSKQDISDLEAMRR